MSELKIDNPAQRLHDLLKTGKSVATNANCRESWQKILGVPRNEEQKLIARLSRVMGLSSRIVQIMEDNFPEHKGYSVHWRDQIGNAFFAQDMNGNWSTFIGKIDTQTLSELNFMAIIFKTRGSHSVLDKEDIESLLEKLIELRSDIRNSNLSLHMRTMLLKQLSQLQDALESYSISGIEPVIDAVQSTLGLAVIDEEYRDQIKPDSGSEFGERVSSLLSDVANVVTVSGALPALVHGVTAALTIINS